MSALYLTIRDLGRLLGAIGDLPAVDQAVRARAEAVATEIAKGGADAATMRLGPGDYEVTASAPNLLSREFGALDGSSDPLVTPALARLAEESP